MASASGFDEIYDSDELDSDESSDEESDDDQDSGDDWEEQENQSVPCRYYNKGSCRSGDRCPYLHICKYALKGNCRNGSNCKLNHQLSRPGRAVSGGRSRASDESTSTDVKLTDGRRYQWQLNNGRSWVDIENNHIIEAQYSLPHTKSIKIYNTPYGAVSIDFNRMRVYGKKLKVRRLDDGNTVWIWYCTLSRKWIKYGEKDAKGNPSPVNNADIEQKFQSNPSSSYTFNKGAETFEIRFKEMQQVGQKGKRKVTRRPQYQQQQAGAVAAQHLQRLQLGTKPQWQFEGDKGQWHTFKHRKGTNTECSVTSDDIERKYQQNTQGTMSFNVKGQSYQLDFGAMTQINMKTKHSRNIRRV